MFQKRLVRTALSGLIAAGAAVTFIVTPVSAGPIGVNAGCRFQLLKVTANELQENRHDEIFLRIGDEYTKTLTFREGETKFAPEFGNAAQTTEFIALGDRTSVGVGEDDFPSSNDLLGSFFVPCTVGTITSTVDGFGSNYDIVYEVVAA